MKIAITGGRDYFFQDLDIFWLGGECARLLLKYGPDLVFLHGDARGVDRQAGALLKRCLFTVEAHPAAWQAFGAGAGMIRNRFLAEQAQIVLAFPGGRGTENMIAISRKLGREIRESPTRRKPCLESLI